MDFFFDIPYTKTVSSSEPATSPQSLPSSTLVQASKYITNHTALSDREAIQCICDISYNVGARFLFQDLTVFQAFCPVELLSLPEPHTLLGTKRPQNEYRSIARTALLHKLWQRGKGDLWVTVLEPEPLVWRPGAQQLCHPVSLWVKLSLHQSSKVAAEPIECSVQARWGAITRFSVVAEGNKESIADNPASHLFMSKTVVLKSHEATLLFPPWYPVAAEEGKSPTLTPSLSYDSNEGFLYAEAAGPDAVHAATMTNLTLFSPRLNMGSTFATNLVSMKYIIDITLTAKDPWGSGRRLSSDFRVPISFSSSETRSTSPKREPCATQCFFHHECEGAEPPRYVS
jgi:hypothetical protein